MHSGHWNQRERDIGIKYDDICFPFLMGRWHIFKNSSIIRNFVLRGIIFICSMAEKNPDTCANIAYSIVMWSSAVLWPIFRIEEEISSIEMIPSLCWHFVGFRGNKNSRKPHPYLSLRERLQAFKSLRMGESTLGDLRYPYHLVLYKGKIRLWNDLLSPPFPAKTLLLSTQAYFELFSKFQISF